MSTQEPGVDTRAMGRRSWGPATGSRLPEENDLVPYWLQPGPNRIGRRVPRLPLSREDSRLPDLRRSLVLYRLVFGQARQHEMIELLKRRDLTDEQIARVVEKLLVDLTPQVVQSYITQGVSNASV